MKGAFRPAGRLAIIDKGVANGYRILDAFRPQIRIEAQILRAMKPLRSL